MARSLTEGTARVLGHKGNRETIMQFRKITAIIRAERMNVVEEKLKAIGVPGVSVTRVKGYGEYAEYFSADWMVAHARIEVFASEAQTTEIADTIMEGAQTGLPGDGIIAVLPVEHLYHIRTGQESNGVHF